MSSNQPSKIVDAVIRNGNDYVWLRHLYTDGHVRHQALFKDDLVRCCNFSARFGDAGPRYISSILTFQRRDIGATTMLLRIMLARFVKNSFILKIMMGLYFVKPCYYGIISRSLATTPPAVGEWSQESCTRLKDSHVKDLFCIHLKLAV